MSSNNTKNEGNKGISIDLNNHENLIVSFGGIAHGLGIPVYEFYKTIRWLKFDKVFIRDLNQAWYHKGVEESINNIDKLHQFLLELLNEREYKRTCFIGNSMGGYAALLFGNLVGADYVLAFSPQTFIDSRNRILNLDFRWSRQLFKIKRPHKSPFDLAKFDFDSCKTRSKIFYGSDSRLDAIHAKKLRPFKNIDVMEYKGQGHHLVKGLRESGELEGIIKEAFEE